MKKTTILWLVGISAFALQCLLVGLSFASVCPMSAVIGFACGLLPLVFVPVLCPLIYRHGIKVWNRRRIYPPWNLISWGVIIAGQVCRLKRKKTAEKTPFFVNGVFLLSNWNNALI